MVALKLSKKSHWYIFPFYTRIFIVIFTLIAGITLLFFFNKFKVEKNIHPTFHNDYKELITTISTLDKEINTMTFILLDSVYFNSRNDLKNFTEKEIPHLQNIQTKLSHTHSIIVHYINQMNTEDQEKYYQVYSLLNNKIITLQNSLENIKQSEIFTDISYYLKEIYNLEKQYKPIPILLQELTVSKPSSADKLQEISRSIKHAYKEGY